MKVACHYEAQSLRSRQIASAMAEGATRAGIAAELVQDWAPRPGVDVGLAYGWGHPETFRQYRDGGRHFVHIDLGWWQRKPDGRPLDGYHKVVVDARNPAPDIISGGAARFQGLGIKIAPWRESGRHIVLAGMSEKSAGTWGFRALEWEQLTIDLLRKLTSRPIIYRPKPSWPGARPIQGVGFSGGAEPIEKALDGAHALVAFNSNTAVDALLAGVPISVSTGPCLKLSTALAEIEHPRRPEGREALMEAIAWQQWSIEEMRIGACWDWLRGQLQ